MGRVHGAVAHERHHRNVVRESFWNPASAPFANGTGSG